jgi:hypothetical protein
LTPDIPTPPMYITITHTLLQSSYWWLCTWNYMHYKLAYTFWLLVFQRFGTLKIPSEWLPDLQTHLLWTEHILLLQHLLITSSFTSDQEYNSLEWQNRFLISFAINWETKKIDHKCNMKTTKATVMGCLQIHRWKKKLQAWQ